ncbi:unnamed protein product, partial [Oppiella nova]
LHYGCDIYVTVGTEEKKQFLVKEYNIPVNRIFNSRDILFKNHVMKATKGRGVDIVLNSLSGDKLDASYQCVANNGRFVELGRFDMIQNKQIGMFDFTKNIQFIGIVFDMVVLLDGKHFFPEFYDWVHKNSKNGCVKPINYTVFKASEAEKAFRFMTTGKHIGKVVLKMRDEEMDRQPLKAIKPAVDMVSNIKTFFDPNKVYIITGGLGGMVKFFESQWIVSTADGFTIKGIQQLLKEAQMLGPIGGVFHLALELNDCLIEKLTFDKFCSSIDTKHKIFTNLDQLTRKLDYKLDYFVVFSSVSCGKGNAGQTNYGFGNSICERICEVRRRDGLHGLAIQWGPIGDVGALEHSDQILSLTSYKKQRINSCFEIKADKQQESGDKEKRMITELWRALGIDPDSTPDHLTLGEIGLESMFAIEFQQGMEKEWNMKFTLNHIKSITIGMLKDYQDGKLSKVQKHMKEIKKGRAMLLKQKYIIPTDPIVALNSVTKGRPVYLMPTLSLNFAMFEELAQKLNRPVIGLNWTREVCQLSTLKEVGHHYFNLLKHIEPKGRYDVVGYLDTALICGKLLVKGMADKVVIVDLINDVHYCDEELTDDMVMEFIITIMSGSIPKAFKDKIIREMKKEMDVKAKVKVWVNEIVDFAGKGLVATDMEEMFHIMIARIHMEEMFHIMIARIRMLSEYRLNKRKKFSNRLKLAIAKKWAKRTGKLVLIKPVNIETIDDLDSVMEKSRDVYFLPGSKDENNNIQLESVDTQSTIDLMAQEIMDKISMTLK